MFGGRTKKQLERRRIEALSNIRGERLNVEVMAQRPRSTDDHLNEAFLANVLARIAEIETNARQAINIDDLNDSIDDAEQQGHLRAYLCPATEILTEGELAIDLMEEWNVPRAVISKLRTSLGSKLKQASTDPESARGALRAILEESDSWASYTDEYEETMKVFTRWLFGATIVLVGLAILVFHWPTTSLIGLLLAGTAGSCVSVLAKMPLLEVTLSGELEAYERRIFSRVATGTVASLIGCALLGWGLFPISIQNQTFADVLDACTTSSPTSCTGLRMLVLLGVPMLFGFSERALTSFEQKVFGNSKGRRG